MFVYNDITNSVIVKYYTSDDVLNSLYFVEKIRSTFPPIILHTSIFFNLNKNELTFTQNSILFQWFMIAFKC